MFFPSFLHTRLLSYRKIAVLQSRFLPKKSRGKGLVHVFTGDGKGKTSAALGIALRALGHGLKVYLAYFMKGDYPYGERVALSKFPTVKLESFGTTEFIDPGNVKPEEIGLIRQGFEVASQAVLGGSYDLVILDEVNLAVAWKLVGLDELISLIEEKPPQVDLVLTGRSADSRLVALADLVTEMVKIKHPYDKGIQARRGIDY